MKFFHRSLGMNLRHLAIACVSLFVLTGLCSPSQACDDTLVMLLTAQNPGSEFSKAIRNFTSSLTILGTALKAGEKDSYDSEMNSVMDSWLEFSKRYMNNPPEEAKNDTRWLKKTSQTAQSVGSIRKLIAAGSFNDAHNHVLELSGNLGAFFEGFGVSDEKKLFINTSTNLTVLERSLLQSESEQSLAAIEHIRINISDFRKILPEKFLRTNQEAENILTKIEDGLTKETSKKELDELVQSLKTSFEEQRSHILMQEWFPEIGKKTEN